MHTAQGLRAPRALACPPCSTKRALATAIARLGVRVPEAGTLRLHLL